MATDQNGLYYMRARYYDQDIKRFINRDIVSGDITNSKSLNRYAYVQGNPVSLIDPFGLCPDSNALKQAWNRLWDQAGQLYFMFQAANDYYGDMPWWERMLHGGYIGLGIEYWGASTVFREGWKFNQALNNMYSVPGHVVLDVVGIVFDPADLANALWYAVEGNWGMAVSSLVCALPYAGDIIGGKLGRIVSLVGRGINYTMVGANAVNAAEAIQNGDYDAALDALMFGTMFSSVGMRGNLAKKPSKTSKLNYTTSTGLQLETTPNRTTTVIGTYLGDTQAILEELGNVQSTDFGPRDGGFNLLNVPDSAIKNPETFWEDFNRPWLDNVIARDDIIMVATEPTWENLTRWNKKTNKLELSGFGREFLYLRQHGYRYDAVLKMMVK